MNTVLVRFACIKKNKKSKLSKNLKETVDNTVYKCYITDRTREEIPRGSKKVPSLRVPKSTLWISQSAKINLYVIGKEI